MASASSPVRTGGAQETLSAVRISQVYRALTGLEPRRTGSDRFRGPATWRDGDGLNVSLDDARGVWHDFSTDEGGGVLDLVVRVRGGSRQEALRWTADFVGRPLNDRPQSVIDRRHWARHRHQVELELPNAILWRRGSIGLGEELLDRLKAALFDQNLPRPEPGEIARWTAQVMTWRSLHGEALVNEYLQWVRRDPRIAAGLVYVARLLETAEIRAVDTYLRLTSPIEKQR